MKNQTKELARYVVNGLVATVVNYEVLYICMEILNLGSAGFSNLLASMLGILCSFLGNRHFVFRHHDQIIFEQAIKFVGLYTAIALLNGAILFIWTDQLGYDYKIGFLIAVCFQVILGYFFAKNYVFDDKLNPIINHRKIEK